VTASRSTSSSRTDDTTQQLEVGRITKPHGVRGEVLVLLTTDRVERLEVGSVLDTDRGPLEVVSAQPHHDRWIVRFAEIVDRDAAEAARGLILRADVAQVDALDDGELWVHDVIGATVVTVEGTVAGACVSVEANPAADLLVLDSGALVPATFVVAHEPGRIVIDPPEGLLDL
jgi:16S rRNA processing protein RimM